MGEKRRPCLSCGKNRAERFFVSTRGRVCETCRRETRRKNGRASRLPELYGITLEEYDALHRFQSGLCAGCGEVRPYQLHVDHDHALEKELGARASVRGLLCKRCNKVLRDVHDSAGILLVLAAYVKNPPAWQVIDADRS